VPVPKQLPVRLPDAIEITGAAVRPLENVPEFVNDRVPVRPCPKAADGIHGIRFIVVVKVFLRYLLSHMSGCPPIQAKIA